MLSITTVKKERTNLGLRVSILVNELSGCESLNAFESCFNHEIKRMKTGNHLHADTLYRIRFEDQFTNNEKIVIAKDHYKNEQQIIFIITKPKAGTGN